MNNPEIQLEKLNGKLLRLISLVNMLDLKNSEELVNIINIYRKTCISQLLYNKYVVSITGLQGVGKTTIIKQLYDIEINDILPENIGTGEQIPVLITESNIDYFKTEVHKLNKNGSIDKIEIPGKEFMDISKHPKDTDVFLELTVPFKYFGNSDVSFFLLPGFEEYNEKDYWQFLTKHALINSANFAFVLDASTYAKEFNRKNMDEFFDDFSDSKPLFILSKSDSSKDSNEELKNNIIKDRQIGETEKDRIICTGTTENLKKIWINDFIKSIEKYKSTSVKSKKLKLKYLSKVLDDELFKVIDSLESSLNRTDKKKEIEFEKKLSRIINPLRSSIEKLRKEFEKEIRSELSLFIQKPIEKMSNFITDTEWDKKLLNLLFGPSAKDGIEFEKKLKDSWINGNNYTTEDLLFKVISDISIRQSILLTGERKIEKLNDINEKDKIALVNYNDNLITDDMIRNLDLLFNSKNNGLVNISESEFNSTLLPTIKLIPSLILENIRLAKLIPKSSEILLNSDTRQKINEINDEFDFSMGVHGNIISAFGVMLGLDGAVDGKIDSIPNLLNALGIQLSERASHILSASIAAVGVAMLIRSMIISINKTEIAQIGNAKIALKEMKEKASEFYLDKYDDIMNYFVEFITNRIKETHHIDSDYARRINLEKIISDIKEIRIKIKESIDGNIKLLG